MSAASPDELDEILARTRDPRPEVRRRAVRELCPCQVKRKDPVAWRRVFELARDPDPGVRRHALHGILDGLPAELVSEAVAVLEHLRDDPEPRIRRQARQVLARHRRTGRICEG